VDFPAQFIDAVETAWAEASQAADVIAVIGKLFAGPRREFRRRFCLPR